MEISTHDLWTVLHGMGLGALFMLAFSGALTELYLTSAPGARASSREQTMLSFYLAAMVIIAWAAVLSGAYIVYPWYRAVPPAGVTDLTDYPRRLLLSSTKTSEWHNFLVPFAILSAPVLPLSVFTGMTPLRTGRPMRLRGRNESERTHSQGASACVVELDGYAEPQLAIASVLCGLTAVAAAA